ncbi:DUF5127 domain-containing protein [Streptomyces sp. SL13]|uniref:DUF5127 domain-containing protein n=1 Tax=Streptantibioticus silvisoli TaxID=2705255 RepID=A0AA90H251_9ACTN|nr:DUF5127 domain-containing protein [Streptantibioticus silvisoli]MDI5971994.1 DUF5127 domain-containing protein [Streptantibioticus silvisoli]
MPPHADRERPAAPVSRRDLLRWGGVATAAAATSGWLTSGAAFAASRPGAVPAASTFSPLRPPATPLSVRSMYLSTYLPGDNLAGSWPAFWNGRTTALCGLARIDGTPYLFAGAPSLPGGPALTTMTQTALKITATQSTYTLTGGGVTLTVSFLSPVDPGNLQRQSVPMSYVTVTAAANDGKNHTVAVYLDASAEWVHGDSSTQVTWSQQKTGSMTALSCQPATPGVLQENGDQASWGSLVLAAPTATGVSWQTGQDTVVRTAFATNGALAGTNDTAQPRAINNNWPVFALSQNLGTVTSSASAAFRVTIGHVRTPAVSYLGADLNPWWTTYWSTWPAMLDWFNSDFASALSAANALDAKIASDASNAVGGGTTGDHYAAVCALALRQAVGGTELVDHSGTAWAFLKEISSDGNVSTIDVTYPGFPAYLYLAPSYLQLLLEPMLAYAETGGWPKTFAEHDLGSSYPNAAGHNDGNEEDMPVEESANMLIMTAAVVQRLSASAGSSFATAHYTILKQWADYLVGNALDPGLQNQTDDFTGFIAHSVNLALKGIIGIGAMSLVAAAAGNTADAAHYLGVARGYISQWVTKGLDSTGQHMKLAYDQDGTWSLKYNGFPDRLLGLGLVPLGVAYMEANWYQSQAGTYGVLLDPRNDYTKADWEMWTAAWLADQPTTRDTLVNGVYGFANTTPQRVPFSDWYVVASGAQQGFTNRPVIGGMFSLLLPAAAQSAAWKKIQNQNSGKVLAVSNQSIADSANVTQYTDNGTNDHLWTVVDNGDGTVKIYNRNSGKLLAVNNQSTADGAAVQQYNDNGSADHLWTLVDAGGGWTKIVNKNSGKVLAVSGMSTADSAQVTQYTDNGSADHLWKLV